MVSFDAPPLLRAEGDARYLGIGYNQVLTDDEKQQVLDNIGIVGGLVGVTTDTDPDGLTVLVLAGTTGGGGGGGGVALTKDSVLNTGVLTDANLLGNAEVNGFPIIKIGNTVYQHGAPTSATAYPVGTYVIDVDDSNHIYEITA